MKPADVRFYRERWKAVREVERQELRALTTEEHWRQINQISRFASEHGLTRDGDEGEMEVFSRWARLKAVYESA